MFDAVLARCSTILIAVDLLVSLMPIWRREACATPAVTTPLRSSVAGPLMTLW
jgi:hypothetical protein